MKMRNIDFDFHVKEVSDSGKFTGYGSIFGLVDYYGDVVMPGAFISSIQKSKEKQRKIPVLWQHRDAIGVYTEMYEDEKGLYLEGQLQLDVVQGAEARSLMSVGAVTGLSIGFMPEIEEWDKTRSVNKLIQVELKEVSIVTFPANDDSRISGVKSIDLITDLKSAEQHLRDSGFSRQQAVAFISKVKGLNPSDSEDELESIAKLIKNQSFLKEFRGH